LLLQKMVEKDVMICTVAFDAIGANDERIATQQ
jgi:hypothetical protein